MATKNKTTETEIAVIDFIHSFVDNEQKKQDSLALIELMKKWSGFEPKMWGQQSLVLEVTIINMPAVMKATPC